VDSIYTDFLKAFGIVRHCVLLEKMSSDIELCPLTVVTFLLFWQNPVHKNERMCFKIYFGYFGRSTGPLCFIWFVNETAQIFELVRVLYLLILASCYSLYTGMRENSERPEQVGRLV
jgi:hypothetical protein